jgi:hypothetical protein
MKSTMIALACALAAPMAFGQTSTTVEQTTAPAPVERTTEQTTTTTAPVTARSTETTTTTTSTDGTVTTFVPGKTIVVRRVGVTDPVTYTLGKTVHYVNKAGKEIKEHMIRPGARVHVYYNGEGQAQVVERVVVDDD